MTKQKIAFLLFSMTGAGEERIASLLLKEFSNEYDISLVLFNGPVDYDIPSNIKITYLRKYSEFFVFRALSLPFVFFTYLRFCKKNKIEISLSFDNVPNYINCLLKIFGWNGKALLREVNFPSIRYQRGIKSLFHRFFIKWCYPKSDILFVNALRIGDDLINNFNIPRSIINLFNNPVDLNSITKQSQSNLPKPAKFTFIHVGAFRPQKNHLMLIKAFEKIKDLDVQLWLIGKGPLEPEIKKEIEEKGLAEKVKILGFQKNPYQYMHKADCMVMTSAFEGLPNVLIEGMACGLPIVSTDCLSGPREMIAPNSNMKTKLKNSIEIGDFGILCPLKNEILYAQALEKIYVDKMLFNQLKENLVERIQEFDLDWVIDNHVKKHLS